MLILTKLHPPLVHDDLVQRPRLIKQLNKNPNRNFTLVSAPAGYGKTTLISSWLAQQHLPYAWLSLDEFDNEPALFLRYIVTAIQQHFPGACATLAQVLQAPDLPSTELLAAIVVNELSQLPEPMRLVLDDYHALHNPKILRLVERLLNQPQNQMHLIIISRIDPLLPLPRLHLQQGLVEVRRQELRFSDQEAEIYLRKNAANQLNPETIMRLNHHLDGWIAGLHMAILSGQNLGATLDSIGKNQEFITNYLFTEVLEEQPLEVQEFLLQTAFIDRFSADLAQDIVTFSVPDTSARSVIDYMQRAHLFIIPLDEEEGWFRYHHLFQQMLQQKATVQVGKPNIFSLHMHAGDWFARHGHVDEALHHYLNAENENAAAVLIEENSRNLLNILERVRLERWMALLPDGIIWQRPRLLVAKAWLYYRHARLQTLDQVLERIQELLEAGDTVLVQDEENFILGQIYALKSATAYHVDQDFDSSIIFAKKAAALLPRSEQGALGTALGYSAQSLLALGRREEGINQLQQAFADPQPQGPAKKQILLGLSFAYIFTGDLYALEKLVERHNALCAVNQSSIPAAHWIAGIAAYEANRLDEARESWQATTGLHFTTNFFAACDSWLGLARICQIQGDFEQAQEHIDAVRSEGIRLECTELLPIIEGMQAFQWHLQGKTALAQRWVSAFQPEPALDNSNFSFLPFFHWVRILVTHGDQDTIFSARKTLKQKLTITQNKHNIRQQIQMLSHLALIDDRLGNHDAAASALTEAVDLAKLGGFIRSIIDAGSEMRPYLQQIQDQSASPHPYIAQLLSAYRSNGISGEKLLTSREKEILTMIQAGLSNREIAQDLVISLYTVKRHASNIYRKLDVDGRHQAVNKAEQIGVLT